jgi:hypothetical protein
VGLRRLRLPISRRAQQVSAVVAARNFLLRLTDPALTPRVSGDVRGEARALLRHYPPATVLRPLLEAGLPETSTSDQWPLRPEAHAPAAEDRTPEPGL